MRHGPISGRKARSDRPVEHVQFTPDGRDIVGACPDSKLRFWSADDGKEVASLPQVHGFGANSLAFSPDGKTLATAHSSEKGSFVAFWRVE